MGIEGNWDRRRISRRTFLGIGGMSAAALALGGPALARSLRSPGGRPAITHGVQSGDVTAKSGIVWARTDRPARMVVEVSPTESLRKARRQKGPVATAETDFTAQLDLRGLPSGEEVFYRVSFEDEERPGRLGEPVVGRLHTAPAMAAADRRDVRFVWSGDTAGQGWGTNPDFGGMRIYETMRRQQPDFFIHSGDTVYADGPLKERVVLPDGTVWRNVLTEEKSEVAQTLDEYRGQHRYNLMDENVRRFNAEVPVFAQWDDHDRQRQRRPAPRA